jgi:hypothetical protein
MMCPRNIHLRVLTVSSQDFNKLSVQHRSGFCWTVDCAQEYISQETSLKYVKRILFVLSVGEI